MVSRFIHLHTHSHYSFLQALPKVGELVGKAKKEGMDALALTDTGNMHGAIEFYKAAKAEGVKPILGVDAYLAPRSRRERDPNIDAKRSRIVLLAENNEGYQNLLALVTKSWTEGFYERPRMDKELLREHSRGIIALLPSFAGDIAQLLRAGDADGAAAALAEFKDIFSAGGGPSSGGGESRVFLEITHHPHIKGHEALQHKIITLARASDTPLVAQHDVYYLEPADREATEIMRRIRQGERGRNEDEDFSFISEERALAFFKDIPEAVDNSRKIADRCNVSFDLGKWTFPSVPVSAGFKNHDEELRAKAYAGIAARGLTESKEVVDRIEYELNIIIGKGFAVYYLIVADLLAFARRAGILTTTRGSAAGSLVAYLTGITNVDPLFYKLPFERFLNPERPKAPDIDMDMADNRRDEMIAYTKQKYGEDHVAQIGTFGTMMARAAVRDVSRALGHSYTTGDRIAKLIPIGSQGFPMTIDKALELEPDLKAIYDEDDDAKEIIDLAKRIEGCVRHVGVHAAGVVVAPTPLVEWTPIQPDPKGTGKLITQYDMYSITDEYGGVGLLKFDFLGIKNLAILADAVARVKDTRGISVDIENVPIDDAGTFAMLARGETEGTFQLNGSGMTRWLKELRPTTIHDINAMVALYRPGPMETIPQYIERKHNPKLIRFVDPRMKEYLDFSYGLLVYQDDVLLTAIRLGGYSWLEADALRKAMGKKIPKVMQAEKEKLLKGFVEYGKLPREKAEKLWSLIEPFAAYGFNKCLPGNTRISLMNEQGVGNTKMLRDIQKGDMVATLDEDAGVLVSRAVESRTNHGVRELFELATHTRRIVCATDNHPLLARNAGGRTNAHDSLIGGAGWIDMKNLTVGEYIAAPKPRIGIFIDGANLYFAERRAGWKVDPSRLRSALTDYGDIRFVRYYTPLPAKDDPTREGKERHIEKMSRYAQVITKPLKYLRNPDAPNDYLRKGDMDVDIALDVQAFSDDYDIALILSGDSDLATLRPRLYAQGKDIVFLGFRFNLAWELTKNGKYLYCEDIRSFVEHTHSENNNAPLAGRAVTSVGQLYTGDPSQSRDVLVDSLGARLLALVYGEAPIPLSPKSDAQWIRIVSMKKTGETQEVFDIEVAGHHSFIADGIIVHNSHAASYGKVAYQTAYMKANYPVEYLAALLTADSGDTDAIAVFVAEARRMGVPVLPPDVNESGTDFTVVSFREGASIEGAPERDGARPSKFSAENYAYPESDVPSGNVIRFGLSSIKNFGDGISESIITERKTHGQYKTLSDFLSRVGSKNLNRKSLESLIKCGALNKFCTDSGGRGTLLASIETLLAYHREATAVAPQDSLFSAGGGSAFGGGMLAPAALTLPPAKPTSLLDKLAWEKELLGIYVGGHPLDAYEALMKKSKFSVAKIKEDPHPGMLVILPVLIVLVRAILTKGGEKMAFITVEDTTGAIEAVVFPKLFKEHAKALVPGVCILVKGKVSVRNGETSLAPEELKPL